MTRKKERGKGGRFVRRAGAAALLAAAFLAAGCFFSPRDAAESESSSNVAEPAKTRDELLTLLQTAFEDFDESQYEVLLNEEFAFHPDRTDSSELADAGITSYDVPWTLDTERDTFNRLLSCFKDGSNRIGLIQLRYTGDPVFTDSSVVGYSTYESDYKIGIYYLDVADAAEDSVVMDGSLKLYIHDEGTSFVAYRWDDFRKGDLPTWGFYKGRVQGGQDYCP